MLMLIVSIFVALAAGVTAFLLLASGDMKEFRKTFALRPKQQLPLVTADGKLIDSNEDLEVQLGLLEQRLHLKKEDVESSKTKAYHVADNIEKLSSASVEVRKYYQQLKDEILRSEKECKDLQRQIEDYHMRQAQIREQMKNNDQNVKDLLKNIRGDSNSVTSLTTEAPSLNTAWNGDITGRNLPISSNESNKSHFKCSRTTSTENNYSTSDVSLTSEEETISDQLLESPSQDTQQSSQQRDWPIDYVYISSKMLQYKEDLYWGRQLVQRKLEQKQIKRERTVLRRNLELARESTSSACLCPGSSHNETKRKKPVDVTKPCLRVTDCGNSCMKRKSNIRFATDDTEGSSQGSVSSRSSRKSTSSNSSCGSRQSSRSQKSWKEFFDERKRVSFEAPCLARVKSPDLSKFKFSYKTLECVAPKNEDIIKKVERLTHISDDTKTGPVLSVRSVKPRQRTITSSNKSNPRPSSNQKGMHTKPLQSSYDNFILNNNTSPYCCCIAHGSNAKEYHRQEYPLLAKFGISVVNEKPTKNTKGGAKLSYSYR